MGDGVNVTARPMYILTHQKLGRPAVFSGLKGTSSKLTVVCCFEVTNPVPVNLDAELAKYAADPGFVAHMKGIKGHSYVYAARPIDDKTRWTPLMKTVMTNAANPDDASPFSVPVIQARFDEPRIPANFTAEGATVSLQTRQDVNGTSYYAFKLGNRTITLSEPGFAD